MHPLDAILDDWRGKAAEPLFSRTRAMGTAFEDLCTAFLTHDPVQAGQFRNVRRFGDWAQEQGLPATDTGVDLVAELIDEPGYFAAIQCKFLETGGSIPKKEIDSFLAASGRTEFRRRVWIDTTGRPWSRNAEETLRVQEKPVQRIGLHYLKANPIDWAAWVASGAVGEREPPRTPWRHQQDAIDSALAHLASQGTRGKLLMACGTGKTLVGLRIAERIAGEGGRVLVLMPSLALLSQTLRAWLDDATVPIRAFAVCSDSQTGRPRRSAADTADMDVLDLAWPATTDAAALASRALPDAPDAMTVVFATYQSSGIVSEAQLDHGLPGFDLAVADEAHRTAGALIPGENPSPFVRIHDADAIHADRRLYMTATPKVYAASARSRAGELATTLCSMDDEDRYGPVLHETRFGDAVDRDLLSDYRVIVLTVPESLAAGIRIREFADGAPLTIDEQGKMIGCLRALAKTDTDEFPEDDRTPMRRAIAFCNLVKSSQRLEGRIHDVAEAYAETYGNGHAPAVSARHVDGTFNATARGDALAFLEEAPEGETRILTNARCLTEGVDVPALDGILFMHPRKSQIEVVQAVGRVMRKAPGKKLGYVILPVVVPSAASPEQALADDKRWQTVWQMLNAIRSHDERFEGMLNRLEMGEAGDRISIIALADWRPPSDDPDIDNRPAPEPGLEETPPSFQHQMVFEGLPEAIRTRIVEKCGNRRYWEDWAGDVARIARAHIERIKAIVGSGEAEREIFEEFLTELRDDLNPEVSEDDAIEMLAQHMVTQPVFDALFGEAAAARRNTVSQGMETVLEVLRPAGIDVEAESLDPFYDSVRRRVQGASSTEARQAIVVELYDKFFRKAFPRVTERLGIVYTPVEIVDFILRSVQDVLGEEFGSALGEPGVHVLDPFTGTGTFIARMMQSGLLTPEQVVRKYAGDGQTPELHANEIVLLAYYIASVNIETAFQGATGADYRPFDGICLTDTFALNENDDELQALFPDNSERRTRQKELDIRVIVGNPPWSAGQRSSADNDWIGQRDEAFEPLYPVGTKEAKAGRANDAVFRLYSRGLATSRDAYVYNFSRDACADNARRVVENYRGAMRDWSRAETEPADIEAIAERHSSNVRWDAQLKDNLRREKQVAFSANNIWTTQYRPFVKQRCYVDYMLVNRKYLQDSIFPAHDSENRAICVPGVGSVKPFSALMVDCMPDLELVSKGQCFPRYRYARREKSDLLDEGTSLERIDNISDTALAAFRTRYGDPAITKDAIFDYVYGVLHAPDYRARFADDLSKTLPRVPFAPDLYAFAEAGRALAELHLGYETGPGYPLVPETVDTSNQPPDRLFGTRSMRLVGDGDSVLVVNDRLRLSGIPADAHRYEVNGRSPLGWFIDRYRITTDKESGIVNDPNAWFADEAAFIAAVRRIVHLSVETARIVDGLPPALDG